MSEHEPVLDPEDQRYYAERAAAMDAERERQRAGLEEIIARENSPEMVRARALARARRERGRPGAGAAAPPGRTPPSPQGPVSGERNRDDA